MKNLLTLLFLFGSLLLISSCNDDDQLPVLENPVITAPSNTAVQVGNSVVMDFSIEAPGKIAYAEVTSSAGSATLSNEEELKGETSGVATVEFVAPSTAGVYTVTLTVTDAQDPSRSGSAAANVTVTEEPQKPVVDIFPTTDGTGTTTWTADNIYVLNGFVYVNNGQTLTIEPGTVIKGEPGTGSGASALIVARGGKIIANGTSSNPIIFTALADDTERTDDLPLNTRAEWGGIIMLGNAFINHANGQTNIEGLPSSDDEFRSLYGVGTDPAGGQEWTRDDNHNGGELTYVSIRHGGTNIGSGNEINGLTMGGVGRGTTIHHVEVYGNDDDGFEWFGGTVNTSYLASIYNQDDSYDMDFGWRGENQFWIGFQEPAFASSNRGWESDGAHSGNLGAEIFTKPTVYNMTIIGAGNDITDNNVLFMTEGFGAEIHNSLLMSFGQGINLTDVGATGKNSRDRLAEGDIVFKNNLFYNIGNGTMTTLSNEYAPLETHLSDNNNEIVNEAPITADASGFQVLPESASIVFTKTLSGYPQSPVNGFEYQDVNYLGAFGSDNWLQGWSAVSAYGMLK